MRQAVDSSGNVLRQNNYAYGESVADTDEYDANTEKITLTSLIDGSTNREYLGTSPKSISMYETSPLYVVMAHELCHAYNKAHNEPYDQRRNLNEYELLRYYRDENGVIQTVREKGYELITTGLIFYEPSALKGVYNTAPLTKYNENAIRKENGLNLQVKY